MACLEILQYRNKECASTIMRSITGCSALAADKLVADLVYNDPPDHFGNLMVPSFANDHCQTSLTVTARFMANLGMPAFDVQVNSAGSGAAAVLASLTNHWIENIPPCLQTNTFRIVDWIVIAPSFPPEHLDKVVNLTSPRITIISCTNDVMALSGEPAQQC